ncbi:MAG: cation transporter [Anaerolineae bacterium]|nr:cation transporter [Anaerolineae bacterium]
MTRQTFKIEGMHCVGCAMTLDGVLEDLPGVVSASTGYARQEVVIEWDERRVTVAQLLEAIRAAGYTAAAPAR